MSVSTTTPEFNIDQMVLYAYRRAGLKGPDLSLTDSEGAAGRVELQLEIDSLIAEGLMRRVVDFFNLTPLVAGVFAYTMPSYVLDVVQAGMFIDPTQTDITQASSETIIRQCTREEWHEVSSKNASGRPVMYYPHRPTALVEVRFWPVPSASEAGGTVRLQVNKLRADTLLGTDTVDAERHWLQYLVDKTAYRLAMASSLPADRCMLLKQDATESLGKCKGASNQKAPQQLVLDHPTVWGYARI